MLRNRSEGDLTARDRALAIVGAVSLEETAHVVNVSVAIVERERQAGRAWLYAPLKGSYPVTPDRWRAITDVFHAALARDAAARESFVADACAGDGALRAEVEALLAAHDEAGLFGAAPIAVVPQLAPGTQLGPYRLGELIGAGGMGEVYRATDTRLDRTVAIKVLSSHLRSSVDLQARFEREARTISQLTHPHICTLYDVGHENGIDYLVMEYLDGTTLSARLPGKPFPLDQALRIGIEIASALDHAHRQGIVHRDLKPGNVMLTKAGAKLLDFGIAKLRQPANAFASSITTLRIGDTAPTTLLGTLHYMAPEQLQRAEADARTDIWALGCVLYEMVTGRYAFDGDTRNSLIAAILEHDPPSLSAVQKLAPLLDHVVGTCLRKEPEHRWQSAADVMRELQSLVEAQRGTGAPFRLRRGVAIAAISLGSVTALAFLGGRYLPSWQTFRPQAPRAISDPVRLTLPLRDQGLTINPGALAISPDGRTLVFAATGPGQPQLYVRGVGDAMATPLAGTDRASAAFFSPDGQWIGFMSAGRGLLKIRISGGPPEKISGFGGQSGAVWAPGGRILFTAGASGKEGPGLWEVAADGRNARLRLRAPAGPLVEYGTPEVLPGGRVVLFTMHEGNRSLIAALVLATGEVKTIIDPADHPRYVETGHLLFVREGNLEAASFDAGRLQFRTAPRILIQNVADTGGGNAPFVVSDTGTLAYMAAGNQQLVWTNRSGARAPLNVQRWTFVDPAISPDGRLYTVTVRNGWRRNLWLGETGGGPLTQLTRLDNDGFGLFSPDSKVIFFASGRSGNDGIFSSPADLTGTVTRLTNRGRPTSVSPDARILLFNAHGANGEGVFQIEIGKPESVRPVVTARGDNVDASFSPDGRWIAYSSNRTGRFEIYVQKYPGPDRGRQVSVAGGQRPQWTGSQGEIVFQGPASIMSVRIDRGRALSRPERILAHALQAGSPTDWAVSPDGRRFLVIEPATPSEGSNINVVLNWFEELKALVPVSR